MTKPNKMLVKKVDGGYQVHQLFEAGLKPANDKVYFHPTSAYAAMGRLVHVENVKAAKLDSDPAKAPAKEPAAQ